MISRRVRISGAAAAIAVFVAVAEGGINPFFFWNVLPVVLGAIVLAMTRDAAAWVYAIVASAIVVFFHAAWLFDWDKTQTGSSTGGLMFVFLPIMAMFMGAVASALGRVVMAIVNRRSHTTP